MADKSVRTFNRYTKIRIWNPEEPKEEIEMVALIVPQLGRSILLGMPALDELQMQLDVKGRTIDLQRIGYRVQFEAEKRYIDPKQRVYVALAEDVEVEAYETICVGIRTMQALKGSTTEGMFNSWDRRFAPGITTVSEGHGEVMFWNDSDESVKIYAGVIMGMLEPGLEAVVASLNFDEEDEKVNFVPIQADYVRMTPEELRQKVEDIVKQSDVSEEMKERLRTYMLSKGKLLGCSGLGYIRDFEYHIELKDDNTTPPPQVIYDYPQGVREEGRELLKELIQEGVAVESESEWSFPIVLVRKPSGGLRFCVDYRKLNKLVKPDKFPVPKIERYLEILGGEGLYTVVDLESGYFQLPLDKESQKYTAFSDGEKHYEFTRLPMGILPAVQVFQRAITAILSGLTFSMCLVYLDDIIIFSKNEEEHFRRVQKVFDRLERAGVTLKLSKLQLGRRRVSYLGHILDNGAILPDDSKIKAIKEFPRPKTVSEVKRFLGIVNWCSSYIPMVAKKAGPLYELLKKDSELRFDDERVEESFLKVKSAISERARLTMPLAGEELRLVTDGSKLGIGGALLVVRDGIEQLVGCVSRSLRGHECNYATEDFETLALIYTLEKFRLFLYGKKFAIYTDHKNLQYLYNSNADWSKLRRDRVQRWKSILMEYDYEILYKKGVDNVVADALSRSPIEVASMRTLMLEAQQQEGMIDEKDEDLGKSEQGKILVPKSMVPLVIRMAHDKELRHAGIEKTLKKLQEKFWWERMRADVDKYVGNCWICTSHNRYEMRAEFQAKDPRGVLSFDVIPELPRTQSGNVDILVMQDLLTRFVVCVPMRNRSAKTVAKAIYQHWISRFGIPRKFLSDDGGEFKNEVLKYMALDIGVEEHVFSTPYHKQSNGINERSHRSLMKMIRSMMLSEGKSWDDCLDGVVLAYNSAVHNAHGRSPFFLMFGQDPNLVGNLLWDDDEKQVNDKSLEQRLKEIRQLHSLYPQVLRRLERQQERRAARWNARLSRHEFKVGDIVYFQKNPDRLRKLSAKFNGPMVIKKQFGPSTFSVKDLRNKRTYKTNISRLKPFLSHKFMSGKWSWCKGSEFIKEYPEAHIVRIDRVGRTINEVLRKAEGTILVIPKWEYASWYKSFTNHRRVKILTEIDSNQFMQEMVTVGRIPWKSIICQVKAIDTQDNRQEEPRVKEIEIAQDIKEEDNALDVVQHEDVKDQDKNEVEFQNNEEDLEDGKEQEVQVRRSGRTKHSVGRYEEVDVEVDDVRLHQSQDEESQGLWNPFSQIAALGRFLFATEETSAEFGEEEEAQSSGRDDQTN